MPLSREFIMAEAGSSSLIVLLIFFAAFLINGGDIISGLYISDDQAVSSAFQNFSQYQQMNDIDNLQVPPAEFAA